MRTQTKLVNSIRSVLDLLHEVLQLKEIPEDLRLRLVDWRSEAEWEIERLDNETPHDA